MLRKVFGKFSFVGCEKLSTRIDGQPFRSRSRDEGRRHVCLQNTFLVYFEETSLSVMEEQQSMMKNNAMGFLLMQKLLT